MKKKQSSMRIITYVLDGVEDYSYIVPSMIDAAILRLEKRGATNIQITEEKI